ncbi:MAG: hypothetical protein KAI43_13325 [Candidatus Aureabacteria bacterium]|nr:hypothetical protein [Candidatus Auribacterota bacterium]
MKQIYFFLSLVIVLFSFLNNISCNEIEYFKFGKAPTKEVFEVKERLSNTTKITTSPFIIKVSRYIDEEEKAFLTVGLFGIASANVLTMVQYERILFINPLNEYTNNLYLTVEYYYYKYPAHQTTFQKSRFRKNDNETTVDPITKFYDAKIYTLKALKPLSKTVIDTPGSNIYFGGRKTAAKEIIVVNDDESTYKIKAVKEYAGYILSIFSGKKLIYQITNNQKLRKKGFKKLSKKLIDKYKSSEQ